MIMRRMITAEHTGTAGIATAVTVAAAVDIINTVRTAKHTAIAIVSRFNMEFASWSATCSTGHSSLVDSAEWQLAWPEPLAAAAESGWHMGSMVSVAVAAWRPAGHSTACSSRQCSAGWWLAWPGLEQRRSG